MTTGGQAGESPAGEWQSRGTGRAVPDTENYLDLSGIEDENPGPHFDVVLRGYDRGQVDEHVSGLRRMVAQLRAQLAVRERRSAAEPATGGAPPSTTATPPGALPAAREPDPADDDNVGAFNDRLRGILQAAEQEAHAVRSKAAEALLAEHAESRAALADLRSQRDAVVDELVRLRGWLDEIVSHPGRTPAAPPPVLSPGPPRQRPWAPPHGRPVAAPPPGVRYGPGPWPPPGAGAVATGPGSGGIATPVDDTEVADAPEDRGDRGDAVDGAETDTAPSER